MPKTITLEQEMSGCWCKLMTLPLDYVVARMYLIFLHVSINNLLSHWEHFAYNLQMEFRLQYISSHTSKPASPINE